MCELNCLSREHQDAPNRKKQTRFGNHISTPRMPTLVGLEEVAAEVVKAAAGDIFCVGVEGRWRGGWKKLLGRV